MTSGIILEVEARGSDKKGTYLKYLKIYDKLFLSGCFA